MNDPNLLAGLDIGGSKVLAVAVDTGGDDGRARVIEQVRLTTFQGPEGVVETATRALTALAGRLLGQSGQHGNAASLFSGVGIGVPGLVDAERGAITLAVNLGVGTGGLALADRLRRRLQLPVVVENDVNAAALGAAAHLRLGRVDLAYLSIGTGLAAGIVLDGVLRRGPHNAAGEIGHVPVDLSGPICGCGQRGCLEAVASGSAIAGFSLTPSPSASPSASRSDRVGVYLRFEQLRDPLVQRVIVRGGSGRVARRDRGSAGGERRANRRADQLAHGGPGSGAPLDDGDQVARHDDLGDPGRRDREDRRGER